MCHVIERQAKRNKDGWLVGAEHDAHKEMMEGVERGVAAIARRRRAKERVVSAEPQRACHARALRSIPRLLVA
jgi:hypothetical protein